MEAIIAYLDTMFSPYPQTPRLLEAKAELREMMEDAYTAARSAGRSHNEAVGQVITEFGNLDELAPVLGIAAELRGAEAPAIASQPRAQEAAQTRSATPAPAGPPIALDEAQPYSEAVRRSQPLLAVAVAMFVIAPAPLIALSVIGERSDVPFTSDIGSFIGIVCVLLLVLLGMALILRRNRELARFERITEGRFEPSPEVDAWAEKQRLEHEGRRSAMMTVAIGLWILSALPAIASGLLDDLAGSWGPQLPGIGVPLTLLMVAVGLLVFLPASWASSVADTLSGDSGESDEERTYPTVVRVLIALLWPITLAVFLLWSFLGDAWSISWIVWPVAGVLHWALASVGEVSKRE